MNLTFYHLKPVLAVMMLLTGFCLISGTASAVESVTADAIVSNLEKKYSGQSFVARFSQISRLAALDVTEKASGTASFSHPGKMKWEYTEPETHQIITNGKTLWIYRPDEKQVMAGDAERFFKSGAGGAFLSDISLIRTHFDIRLKEIATDYFELDLVNKNESAEITSIVMRISRHTYEIIRAVSYNPFDDSTLFEFYDIRFTPLDPGLFEFSIPAGADLIQME